MSLEELNKDKKFKIEYDYWKNYRNNLVDALSQPVKKEEKTEENIYQMAKQVGIKATSRYYNTTPSTIRYYIKKYKEKNQLHD